MHARRWAATAAVLGLGAGLAGCGGDDDDDAAHAGDLATYCERTVEIETIGEPEIDFASASEDEVTQAAIEFATDELLPIAEAIEASAPAAVAEDVDVLHGAVVELAESGDFESAFDTAEVEAASDRVHEFDLASCGWERVDVTTVDYAFEGIPSELPAGVVSFELTNPATELHELVVIRKHDDTVEPFDVLLAMPPGGLQAKTSLIGGRRVAPGSDDSLVTELVAGEYLAVCFVPVGTVAEDSQPAGPPHFTQGMRTAFTVS